MRRAAKLEEAAHHPSSATGLPSTERCKSQDGTTMDSYHSNSENTLLEDIDSTSTTPHSISQPNFVYQKLTGNRVIRLLKFLPGSTPSYTLIDADVDEAPPYLALSYTWGAPVFDHSVIINGCSLPITKNLADALAALRGYARGRYLMLWADAACINQGDIRERSSQVRLMNAIYRSAECVAIWLGESADYSDFIMDKMVEWKAEFDRISLFCNNRSYDYVISIMLSTSSVFNSLSDSDKGRAWRALDLLLRRPWWRRAWVVQETTLIGATRTYFFCGNRMANWECFRTAFQIYTGANVSRTLRTDGGFDHGIASRTHAFKLDTFRFERETGVYMPLLRVLQHIRSYECVDPRNKMFPSLGIAVNVTEADILPDYSKPVGAIYISVARFLLSSSSGHELDFLGHVERPAEDSQSSYFMHEAVPSWVPDWRTNYCPFAFQKFTKTDEPLATNLYNASGSLVIDARVDRLSLHARGLTLDTVVEVLPICEEIFPTCVPLIKQSWRPSDPEGSYAPTGESLDQAFNRALLADRGNANLHIDSEIRRGFAVDWTLVFGDTSTMSYKDERKRYWMLLDLSRIITGRRFF